MAEGAVDKPLVNRRRIIERPRLTRLLDESPARIKMLVAPAGYGKTTLARQWLSGPGGRQLSWVTCSPASSDIAVLLEQIAGAAELWRPIQSETVGRLRAMPEPARQLPLLIELLAEDLSDWPRGMWLVFDDYHEIMVSAEAEDVVAEVIARTRVNAFITSRRRPSWATARGLFYGELYELTQNHLAMTTSEIAELLSRDGDDSKHLVAVASGWPAFIALAAAAEHPPIHAGRAQTDLYDFLLDEIFVATDVDVQHALRELALAPRDHGHLLRALHPPEESMRIAAEATRVGMLTAGPDGDVELHPLLRQFLHRQCLDAGDDAVDTAVSRLWAILRANERWDDLFDLAVSAERPQYLSLLLRESVDKLLSTGRSASLRRWLTYAKQHGLDDWIMSLAEAKLALREGSFGRARMFALEAVDRAATDSEDLALAWCIAGQAAHLQNDEESALSYYRTASTLATSPSLRRIARWGRFVSSVDAESPDAALALNEIVTDQATGSAALVDRWNAQLLYEIRIGGLRSLKDARVATEVVDLVEDPVRRTAFRSIYASALALSAEYHQARVAAQSFLADARTARVDFALPYAHTVLGVALLGLREFDAAADATRQAVFDGERLADTHAVANAHAVIARLLLSQCRYLEAIDELDGDFGSAVTRGMMGESIGCRAVALACLGDESYAGAATEACVLSSNLESKMLAVTANAIFHSVTSLPDLRAVTVIAVDTAVESGAWDLFVCGYRAHPEFLLALRDEPNRLKHVLRVMERAGDTTIARALGLSAQKRGLATLSPRESEILALVALGLTNKQIAERLFISHATAKVHVHHILEKLDVKTRTAAAARYQRPEAETQATETSC